MTGVVALASLSIASAKSYEIKLDNPTRIGGAELKAGDYHVKVEGSNVVFTNADSSKSFTAPAKIEQGGQKFDQTMVLTHNSNGVDSLAEIDLGGSATRVEFQQ
jgi:hypothetical protein